MAQEGRNTAKPMSRTVGVVWLIIVGCCYGFGLYFFCRGFLLTRHTVLNRSSCKDVVFPKHRTENGTPAAAKDEVEPCWTYPTYHRVVIILIDALRFDFLEWQENSTAVHQLLEERPDETALLRFIADPPTTTLQRLKGITTGSLPTFIDAGSNFDGSQVDEDNIIQQVTRAGGKIAFLGDDTWQSLYPNDFRQPHFFPSFDVKDLHSVDNGILKRLYRELPRPDWKVLIAHFLGVDHAGHKYGPNHDQMSLKLEQMDRVIENTTRFLGEKTLLVVMGDHGMTSTGDHGGDSPDEINAGLFLYSPGVPLSRKGPASVKQVDLVPSLSLLLNIPVPFSSLGTLIPQLFPDLPSFKAAAEANVWQVVRYAETYLERLQKNGMSQNLETLLREFHDTDLKALSPEEILDMIRKIRDVFEESWARFNPEWMLIGVMTLVENIFFSLLLINNNVKNGRVFFKSMTFLFMAWAVVCRTEYLPPSVGILVCTGVAYHALALLETWLFANPPLKDSINYGRFPPFIIFFLSCAALFSNSFIVYEDYVARFLCQTLFVVISAGLMRQYVDFPAATLKRKLGRKIGFRDFATHYVRKRAIAAVLLALCFIALGRNFNRCREEQGQDCVPSQQSLPFTSLPDNPQKIKRVLIAVSALFALNWVCRTFLSSNGHLYANSVLVFCNSYSTYFVPAMITAFWLGQFMQDEVVQGKKLIMQIRLPQLLYGLFGFSVLAYLWNPRSSCLKARNKTVGSIWPNGMIDQRAVFQHLNRTLQLGTQTIPYGWATLFSGPMIHFLVPWIFFLLLLLGDGITPIYVLNIALIVFTMELGDVVSALPLWCLLPVQAFYAFGHHATFSSIPWDPAFIGIPGNFHLKWVQAAPVVINVFAGHIMMGLALPLLILWPFVPSKLGMLTMYGRVPWDETEMQVIDRSSLNVSLHCVTLQAVRMFSAVICAVYHKRHLMLWKIFAPKFIYECLSFLVFVVAVIIGQLAFYRIEFAVTRYMKKNGINFGPVRN